jgi:hypothetical protein
MNIYLGKQMPRHPKSLFAWQREIEKFKVFSPQQRLDYLREGQKQISLDVIEYQDSEGLGLIPSWKVKDGCCCPLSGSITNFPYFTVVVLDEKIL